MCSRGFTEKRNKSEVATLPLPSRGHKIGWNSYTTCWLGGPQKKGQNQKWQHHPSLLGGPRFGNCYLTAAFKGVPKKGDKFRRATSPLPFGGAKIGWNCHITCASPGLPSKGARCWAIEIIAILIGLTRAWTIEHFMAQTDAKRFLLRLASEKHGAQDVGCPRPRA